MGQHPQALAQKRGARVMTAKKEGPRPVPPDAPATSRIPQPYELHKARTATLPPEENAQARKADNGTAGASVFDDLDSLRVDQDHGFITTVERLTHIPVRKPNKVWFIRVNPDPAMSLVSTVFEDKDEDRDTYFVMPAARGLLDGLGRIVQLTVAVNVQGVVFVWPVPMPDSGGPKAWASSARAALDLARTKWIRVQPDLSLGAYRIHEAQGKYNEPTWPDLSFQEILKLAFKERIIDSANHPVIRKLQGLS
jgi:hypothetical protein